MMPVSLVYVSMEDCVKTWLPLAVGVRHLLILLMDMLDMKLILLLKYVFVCGYKLTSR